MTDTAHAVKLSWLLIPVLLLRLVLAPACACVLGCDAADGHGNAPLLPVGDVASESCCGGEPAPTECPCCTNTTNHTPHETPCDPANAALVWSTMRSAVILEQPNAEPPRLIAGRTDRGKGAGDGPDLRPVTPLAALPSIELHRPLGDQSLGTTTARGSTYEPGARRLRARLCVWVL